MSIFRNVSILGSTSRMQRYNRKGTFPSFWGEIWKLRSGGQHLLDVIPGAVLDLDIDLADVLAHFFISQKIGEILYFPFYFLTLQSVWKKKDFGICCGMGFGERR